MISFTKEQIFIVTGASSGIGEGVALLLNELGASVVAVARRQKKLQELKEKAKYPENIYVEPKDLAEDIEGLPIYVKTLKEKYGKFQGMACCAGISWVQPLRVAELSEYQKMFDINYFAPIFMLKGFADKRNHQSNASVVCIASIAGVHPTPGQTCYAGTKGALIASLTSAAGELAPTGLRINCVSPSLIDTSLARDISRQYAEGKYPFGLGHIEDVANVIVFLLSDKSKWITKQNYIIDCGVF